jgi:ABC-type polysaccharide/polyol phosphate transport system ATPase subunit
MSVSIILDDVSLKFRIYRNPSPNLKESFLNVFNPKHHPNDVVEFFALKDINVSFKPGDRVGIIGLNGAGKSTLLKAIAGIYHPLSGRIKITGSVTPMIELGAGFDYEMTGRQNIYLNGAILGFSKEAMKRREKEIIEFSELGDFINMPVKYYSSGMFSRLAFSIAVISDPEILIVDEILAAGDAHFVQKATDRMRQLFNTSQIVLFVSHSLDQVEKLCNRVLIMHKGEIVEQGNAAEMIKRYKEHYVNL